MSSRILLLHGREEEEHHPTATDKLNKLVIRPYPALFLGLGLLLLAVGAMLPPRLHQAVEEAVWEQIRLDSPDSPNLPAFVHGSSPTHPEEDDLLLLKFYFFHVENAEVGRPMPDLIINRRKKRYRVVERGPYVYSVQLKRLNLSFVDLEHPRRELYYKTWQQVKHVVGGKHGGRSDAELITTVSMPYQFLKALTGVDLPLFVTKSVHEHLFGYEQGLIKRLPIKFPGFVLNFSTAREVDQQTRVDGQRVDSNPQAFTYQNFQAQSILKRCATCVDPLWRTLQANRVQGGDGRFWGRHTDTVFLPELSRHVKIVRGSTEGIEDGIKVRDYTLDTQSLFDLPAAANGDEQPQFNDASLNGVFNLSRAYLGVPLFASKPRFLDGDDQFVRGVDGLERATRSKHDTVFRVHEPTQLAVKVALRLQYNIRLPDVVAPHHVYLPVFWFETDEEMSDEHKRLFSRCDGIVAAAAVLASACTALGIACVVAGIVISTNRAETDAKRRQRRAAVIFAHEECNNSHGDHEDDDAKPLQGLALILSSPSLRWGWASTPPFVFAINLVIELITLRKDKHIGVWRKYSEHSGGAETVFAQTLLTAFIVALTVAVDAVQKARSAFIDGEVPQRTTKYKPFDSNRVCGLPWRLSGDACKLGASVGVACVLVLGVPLLVFIDVFVCGMTEEEQEACVWDWRAYILGKAMLAATLGGCLYPFAALRALHQDLW